MCFFPVLVNKCWGSLVCQVCVSAGIHHVCVSFSVQNALVGGTSVFECMCECACVVYQLVRRRWVQGTSARVALRCVDYFLPYIAMTGHVVSPVVVDGQWCSSLLAPLPLSLKPEHKRCLLGSHGLVHMCSGPRPTDSSNKHVREEPQQLDYQTTTLYMVSFSSMRSRYSVTACGGSL